MSILLTTIKQELDVTFKMLKVAASRIDGDFWTNEENKWMYGYTLFHAVEALEFHINDSPEQWVPLNEVSVSSEQKEKEKLKTLDREFFVNHIDKVELKFEEVLGNYSDDDLLETDGFASRGHTCRLEKLIYVTRHAMLHIGELSKTLRDLGLPVIKWQYLNK